MNKVFVIVDNPRVPMNFLQARKFGELEIMFDHNVSPTFMQRIYPILQDKLQSIGPADYVIPTGPPALIALVGSIIIGKLGKLRLLQWDRETSSYYLVETDIGEETRNTNDTGQEALRSEG